MFIARHHSTLSHSLAVPCAKVKASRSRVSLLKITPRGTNRVRVKLHRTPKGVRLQFAVKTIDIGLLPEPGDPRHDCV
jgi:hypothetical protein